MKIAMCVSELVPFAKTGGLADVAKALSVALEKEGQDIVIIMPKYKQINKEEFKLEKICADIYYSVIGRNIKVYFIENEKFFSREGLYQDENGDYADNLRRFAYFCRRSLSLLKELEFKADIIHLHDWQSALVAVYLKTVYSRDTFFKGTRTLLTLHNLGYQGIFSKDEFSELGLDWDLFDVGGLEFYGNINLLKGGIVFADLINTVSPTYRKEIMTQEFGFGLEGVLSKRSSSLYGILNGLDTDIWDPAKDKLISFNFSSSDSKNKARNKKDLRQTCNLPGFKDLPLIGIVSRIAQQKGFSILLEGIEEILNIGVQLVILGTGDPQCQHRLKYAAKRYPESISVNFKFDDPLAHKIYAGSDIFLMPSSYEPCGLGQMIALKYGTIPVVFKTGGLADTINPTNGFLFTSYNKIDLIKAVKAAVRVYKDKDKWAFLVSEAMKSDFSWKSSAKKYLKLYEKAKGK